MHIPFNRPLAHGTEADAVTHAIANSHLSADGPYSARCRDLLLEQTGAAEVMLTHSCTAALEISALVAEIKPGDEVIMPSFAFVTTASAFALRGARPVFVDIRPDTLNLDERLLPGAIGQSTRAIVPVHYAGVGCEIDEIASIAAAREATVIEDAAQGALARINGRALGSIGALGTISFHETKNITCGEGGALLVNDPQLVDRARIVRDKGTNRAAFLAGEAERYTWVALGSSYGLSDLNAAFLWEQLGGAERATALRRAVWDHYHAAFAGLEERGLVRRPIVPDGAEHNAHLYYLLVRDGSQRDPILKQLNDAGVNAVFHYVPLHSSPMGRRLGRVHGSMEHTDDLAARLIRLPMWSGMPGQAIDRVIDVVHEVVATSVPA